MKKAINQPGVVGQAQVAADYMLQQTSRRLFGELQDHFALKEREPKRRCDSHDENGSRINPP